MSVSVFVIRMIGLQKTVLERCTLITQNGILVMQTGQWIPGIKVSFPNGLIDNQISSSFLQYKSWFQIIFPLKGSSCTKFGVWYVCVAEIFMEFSEL